MEKQPKCSMTRIGAWPLVESFIALYMYLTNIWWRHIRHWYDILMAGIIASVRCMKISLHDLVYSCFRKYFCRKQPKVYERNMVEVPCTSSGSKLFQINIVLLLLYQKCLIRRVLVVDNIRIITIAMITFAIKNIVKIENKQEAKYELLCISVILITGY